MHIKRWTRQGVQVIDVQHGAVTATIDGVGNNNDNIIKLDKRNEIEESSYGGGSGADTDRE